jgi:hypothetical protein
MPEIRDDVAPDEFARLPDLVMGHVPDLETITKWGLRAFMLAGHGSESWYACHAMNELSSMMEVYQLHVWLCEISPLIWRRLLVRSDSTIADLHYTLQIAMGWDDAHLHRFRIRGKDYGISRIGGIDFRDDPHQVRLCDFHFRHHERFLYEYDFGDLWPHVIRVEQRPSLDETHTYPVCIGGKPAAPPEDCGGPWAFMALQD